MKADLIPSLYVFMLAAFIGFEVIRRVSPLLHTPLMSLTNALGCHRGRRRHHPGRQARDHAVDGARHHRHRGRHQQHCRRIHHHRSHAEDVQSQPDPQTMTSMAGRSTSLKSPTSSPRPSSFFR